MRKILFASFLISFSQLLFGQNDSLINSTNEIFEIYSDRAEYIPGETIWFKINHIGLPDEVFSSKIIYVEIINPLGYSLSRKKILVKSGVGFGEFQLSDTLSTGMYKIIAYSQWMRNFNNPKYYATDILIYNPEKKAFKVDRKKEISNIDISFDGNNIINNLLNTVYYRLENDDFEGARIAIKKKDGTFIAEKKLDSTYGEIEFVASDNVCEFVFSTPDTIIQINLPEPITEGIIFKLTDCQKDHVEINVYCTNYIKSTVKKIYYSLNSLTNRKVLNLENKIRLDLINDSLKEGKNHVVFTQEDGSILWERDIYYSGSIENLKIDGLDLRKISKRSLIKLQIDPENNNITHDLVNVSVAIRKIPNPGEVNYSESLRNLIEEKAALSLENLNNKMAFKSNIKLKDIKYLPEFKGALLSGKIINKDGKPIVNNDVFLCYVDSVVRLNISKTNSDGVIQFFVKQDIPIKEIVINANNHNKDLVILINNNFLNEYTGPNQKLIQNWSKEYQDYLDEMYVNQRIKSLYDLDYSQIDSTLDFGSKTSFYKDADRVFNLDSYLRLDSIHEYFYEIIGEVNIVRQHKERQLRVFNKQTSSLYKNPPAMFVDGVYIEDPKLIFNLDPDDCKSIEIIQKPVLLKNRTYDGLIAIYTYKNDLPVSLASNMSRMEYSLFDKSEKFEYTLSTDDRIPSLRNTLYWNPELIIGSDSISTFEFYTGDDDSCYELVIRGFTNNGKRIYTRKVFKVAE